jgi:uncharacterized protein YndB with AHSA1/START domain
MEGTAQRTDDGGYLLRFERHFDHPIEKVWSAITDPSELTKWIAGDEAVVEPCVGGRVFMSGHGGIEATMLAFEPPRLIEYDWKTSEWDGGPIRWELSEEGSGTKLTFTHRFPQPDMAEQERLMKKMGFGPDMYDPIPRTLAGWHSLIEELQATLDGVTTDHDVNNPQDGAQQPRWKQLHNHYVERYSTTGS